MRIAFFGLPLAALALHREGHDVVLAALCREGAPGTRRLRRAIGSDNVLMRPHAGNPDLRKRIERLAPDIFVSWFWTKKLPLALVRAARCGGFGVHPSLLPRWRGPDPYFWAIDSGDALTGVTAHRIEAEYDTGAILGRRELAIDPRWDAWQLARALDAPSLRLMLETVDAFARARPPMEERQDEEAATDAPLPDDELLEIDWQRPAEAIVRRVRAAAPYPGAWTFIGDEALVVTRAEVADRPAGLVAGEGAIVGGRLVVAAGEGAVALLRGRHVRDDDHEEHVENGQIAAILSATKVPGSDDSR